MTIWYQLRCGKCESLTIGEDGRCMECGEEAKRFEFSGVDDTSELVKALKEDFLSGRN